MTDLPPWSTDPDAPPVKLPPRHAPSSAPGGPVSTCAGDDCSATIKNHAWGRIKAEGWFQQKDGTVWCPTHVPEWVEAWRKRRDAGDPPQPWKRT